MEARRALQMALWKCQSNKVKYFIKNQKGQQRRTSPLLSLLNCEEDDSENALIAAQSFRRSSQVGLLSPRPQEILALLADWNF